MIRIILGIFILLHGIVFIIYAGQSIRIFQLEEGMNWPDDSFTFSNMLSKEVIRLTAFVSFMIAGLGFMTGGILFLFNFNFWSTLVSSAAILSIILIVLFWDGKVTNIKLHGGIGILINVLLLLIIYVIKIPF